MKAYCCLQTSRCTCGSTGDYSLAQVDVITWPVALFHSRVPVRHVMHNAKALIYYVVYCVCLTNQRVYCGKLPLHVCFRCRTFICEKFKDVACRYQQVTTAVGLSPYVNSCSPPHGDPLEGWRLIYLPPVSQCAHMKPILECTGMFIFKVVVMEVGLKALRCGTSPHAALPSSLDIPHPIR